jgi:predicted DNA-binding transcriptional regulator YafY
MRALLDTGQTDAAETIAQLLLDRSELSMPLRNEIEQLIAKPFIPWRQEIDQYIHRQAPFQLTYRDAADRPWTFTIRNAKVVLREKRQYLECWCEETEGNQDLPELQHNRTLRLDRIPEAALGSVPGQWRSSLDGLKVEMYLLGGLAFAYQSRPEDETIEWLVDQPQVRRVVRRISSTFWFFREVLPYGKDCVVVSPESVRSRFKAELRSLCEQYEI